MPNAPAISRPDVKAIAARAEKMLENKHFWEGPAWADQLIFKDIPALIARIEAMEAVVKKEVAVIENFMARINPTELTAADDQQYVVSINAIENLEALAALGDGDG